MSGPGALPLARHSLKKRPLKLEFQMSPRLAYRRNMLFQQLPTSPIMKKLATKEPNGDPPPVMWCRTRTRWRCYRL